MTAINCCRKGHEYTQENLRIVVIKGAQVRQCRQCDKDRAQAKRDALRGDRQKFKKSNLAEFCLRGHALAGDNLYWYQTKNGPQRRCRACEVIRDHKKVATQAAVQPTNTHCVNGHPMEGDNLGFRPNGYAMCKACALARSKKSQAADKDETLYMKRQSSLARKLAIAEEAKKRYWQYLPPTCPRLR